MLSHEIFCQGCNKPFNSQVPPDQALPMCQECFGQILSNNPKPPVFIIRWFRILRERINAVKSDYIIVKVHTVDCVQIPNILVPGTLIPKEIIDTDYFNLKDRKFYGPKAHATPMNYFLTQLLIKRFRKENNNSNIEYWAEPVIYMT